MTRDHPWLDGPLPEREVPSRTLAEWRADEIYRLTARVRELEEALIELLRFVDGDEPETEVEHYRVVALARAALTEEPR